MINIPYEQYLSYLHFPRPSSLEQRRRLDLAGIPGPKEWAALHPGRQVSTMVCLSVNQSVSQLGLSWLVNHLVGCSPSNSVGQSVDWFY